MSGRGHRQKGDRIERDIVDRHRELGIQAERYSLSGATWFRSSGHDADIYLFGADEAPIKAEGKGRKNGAGFAPLENWLGEYDALFLRKDRSDPMVVVPWRLWARLVERVRQTRSQAPPGPVAGVADNEISTINNRGAER